MRHIATSDLCLVIFKDIQPLIYRGSNILMKEKEAGTGWPSYLTSFCGLSFMWTRRWYLSVSFSNGQCPP